MALSVYRTIGDLYFRQSGWRPQPPGGWDKTGRIKLDRVPSATESGVVDFLGERIINSNVLPANFGAAYAASPVIMKYGGEESPNVIINGIPMGGNHRIPAVVGGDLTVTNYSLTCKLNGTTLPIGVWWPGVTLVLHEEYDIPVDVTNPTGAKYAHVIIEWWITGGSYITYTYKIECITPFDLGWYGSQMSQGLVVPAGSTLHLKIPDSVSYAVQQDITATGAITIDQSEWADPVTPVIPYTFETTVKTSGAPQYTFMQQLTGGLPRGEIDPVTGIHSMQVAWYRHTSKKMYVHAVEYVPPKTLCAGDTFTTTGQFGCRNGA